MYSCLSAIPLLILITISSSSLLFASTNMSYSSWSFEYFAFKLNSSCSTFGFWTGVSFAMRSSRLSDSISERMEIASERNSPNAASFSLISSRYTRTWLSIWIATSRSFFDLSSIICWRRLSLSWQAASNECCRDTNSALLRRTEGLITIDSFLTRSTSISLRCFVVASSLFNPSISALSVIVSERKLFMATSFSLISSR